MTKWRPRFDFQVQNVLCSAIYLCTGWMYIVKYFSDIPLNRFFCNYTLELILLLGIFNLMIKYLCVLPFHCKFFTPCKKLFRAQSKMRHTADGPKFHWETLQSPTYFWTLHLSEHIFREVAEMTLILTFQQYCVFSVNPINKTSSSSEEDMKTAFVVLILLTLHKSVNPAKTVTQLVCFQHQLQQKWPMTCPLLPLEVLKTSFKE